MLITPHILFGAAVGKAFGDAYIAVPIAFLTHYFLDFVPHYALPPVKYFQEKGICKENIWEIILKSTETVGGIIISVLLMLYNDRALHPAIIWAGVAAVIPDFLVFLEWKFGIRRPWPFYQLEKKYHSHTTMRRGLWPQILFSVIFIVYLLL